MAARQLASRSSSAGWRASRAQVGHTVAQVPQPMQSSGRTLSSPSSRLIGAARGRRLHRRCSRRCGCARRCSASGVHRHVGALQALEHAEHVAGSTGHGSSFRGYEHGHGEQLREQDRGGHTRSVAAKAPAERREVCGGHRSPRSAGAHVRPVRIAPARLASGVLALTGVDHRSPRSAETHVRPVRIASARLAGGTLALEGRAAPIIGWAGYRTPPSLTRGFRGRPAHGEDRAAHAKQAVT